MNPGGIQFEPMDLALEAELAARLLDHRRRLFDAKIQAIDGERLAAGFGEQAGSVLRGVAELCAWSSARSRLRRRAEGWAAGVVLLRVFYPAQGAAARSAAVRNLDAFLALGRIDDRDGDRAPAALTSDGDGAVLDLEAFARLRLPYGPHTPIECRYQADRAILRPLRGGGPIVELGGGDEDGVERVPLARAPRWDLPLFDSSEDLGFDREGPDGGPSHAGPGDGEVLPFESSLAAAHELLARLWPETIAWIRALAPAFVCLGRPVRAGVNRSETYEAGGPIFLALVDDPFKHAESLVHEIQHHRFRLWASAGPLACTRDQTHRFISPYRPDLRRLFGVHMGVHAFAAVNELRLRARRAGLGGDRLERAALRTHFANLLGFRTIVEHDRGGQEARSYVGDLASCLLAHHRVLAPLVSPSISAAVDEHFSRHRAQAMRTGGPAANDDESYLRWDDTLRIAQRAEAGASLSRFDEETQEP